MDAAVKKTDNVRAACQDTIYLMDKLDRFRPEIEKALGFGIRTHTFDDIVEMIMAQRLIVRFYGEDAFAFVMITKWPQASHYHIFLAGGNLQTLMEAIPEMERDALSAGCDRVTINGRPGWARQLESIGARHAYTMLAIEVPLSHG